MSDLVTYRDSMLNLGPTWLRGFWGSRLIYALAIQWDALIDATVMAVKMRFPGWSADNMPDALALIGRERGIIRGFAESNASYAVRLTRWIDDRRIKGNPYALMAQLQGYLSGFPTKMRIVNQAGAWYTLNADGTKDYFAHRPSNWTWDIETTQWSRYWIILYPPSELWVTDGVYGDAAPRAAGGTIGSSATLDQINSIRAIVKAWTPPHASCEHIIVAFDPASFDPTSHTGMPDGTWGRWSKLDGTEQKRARLETARYWRATP